MAARLHHPARKHLIWAMAAMILAANHGPSPGPLPKMGLANRALSTASQPVVSTGASRSEAKWRDLISTPSCLFAERRSLRFALRAPVETTGGFKALRSRPDVGTVPRKGPSYAGVDHRRAQIMLTCATQADRSAVAVMASSPRGA